MSKHERWKDIPKDIIPLIIKIEAFKVIYPGQYEKLLTNLEPDIDQLISEHYKLIKEMTWH